MKNAPLSAADTVRSKPITKMKTTERFGDLL